VTDRADIENAVALADYVKDIVDANAFAQALTDGVYKQRVEEGNDYTYEHHGVWAVPSYRMNGAKLDAKLGVGVTKEDLHAFIKKIMV